MKFENAKIEIELLKNLDVVLEASVNVHDANLNDDTDTKYHDDDFGL